MDVRWKTKKAFRFLRRLAFLLVPKKRLELLLPYGN